MTEQEFYDRVVLAIVSSGNEPAMFLIDKATRVAEALVESRREFMDKQPKGIRINRVKDKDRRVGVEWVK